VVFSCGVHPLNLDEAYQLETLQQLAADSQVVALGETGLDYFYQKDAPLLALQQQSFRQHIQVARQLRKPVIVHTRDARNDTLAILRDEQAQDCRGVLHCFTEDIDTARVLLDLGFYISFSGIVTFRNADALREVARFVPLDRLLVETDSPYLAPVPYRGKENQPAYVREVAQYLSVLKGVSLAEIAEVTTDNFCSLFGVNALRLKHR
jgi:TatD DNase family protein